jgi:MSHA biogenesis protein MshK
MDETVNATALIATLSILMALAPVQAQSLSDPTVPPAALMSGSPSAVPAAPFRPQEPRVQAILISLRDGGRRVAVIDGRTMHVGDKIDGAVLSEVTQTSVVLRKGKTLRTLKLFPAASAAIASAPKP